MLRRQPQEALGSLQTAGLALQPAARGAKGCSHQVLAKNESDQVQRCLGLAGGWSSGRERSGRLEQVARERRGGLRVPPFGRKKAAPMLAPGLKAAPNGRAIAFPVPQAGPWWADHRTALQFSAVPTLDSRYRSGSRRASQPSARWRPWRSMDCSEDADADTPERPAHPNHLPVQDSPPSCAGPLMLDCARLPPLHSSNVPKIPVPPLP